MNSSAAIHRSTRAEGRTRWRNSLDSFPRVAGGRCTRSQSSVPWSRVARAIVAEPGYEGAYGAVCQLFAPEELRAFDVRVPFLGRRRRHGRQ